MRVVQWLRSYLFGDTVCPRCGESVSQDEAREYDPYGNRWENRAEKEFDYFCRPCYRFLTKSADNTTVQERATEAAGAETKEAFVYSYISQAHESMDEQEQR